MVDLKLKIIIFIAKILSNINQIKLNILHNIKKTDSAIKIPLTLRRSAYILENGGIITKSYRAFNKIVKYNKSENTPIFYNDIYTWDYKAAAENRYNKNLKFLQEHFIPLLKSDDTVCDIGCASGQYTFEMAKYCKCIDGYDMSQNLVNDANKKAKDAGINNVHFYQGACQTIHFDRVYDNMSFMGVLCCVMDDKAADKTIKNLYKGLKKNGYLIYKDNSNNTGDNYYFFGPEKNYFMVARAKKRLANLFKKNGFKIINEDIFDEVEYKNQKSQKIPIETISIGMILQKV